MKKIYIFLLCLTCYLNAQTIHVKLSKNITSGTAVLEAHPSGEKKFAIIKNGESEIKIPKKFNQLILTLHIPNYEKFSKPIKINELKKRIIFIDLESINQDKFESIELEGIEIKAKEKHFYVRKDTTFYSVNAMRNGTEESVEDLLKKLPGIKVEDGSGIIKYKGKEIETLTLDGDNIFDHNYQVGSKNINIDMVKQIQAIENYTDKKLLKGLENDNKVSINLILKKNVTDHSFDVKVASGLSTALFPKKLNLTHILINKKFKSINIASHNNINENYSSFNYLNSNALYKDKSIHYQPENLISNQSFYSVFQDSKTINQTQNYLNTNTLIKIDSLTILRFNAFYNKEDINQESKMILTYFDENQSEIFDSNKRKKKPELIRGDFMLLKDLNSKSNLKIESRFFSEKIANNTNIVLNDSIESLEGLYSNTKYIHGLIEYTRRINKDLAIEYSFLSNYYKITQDLKIDDKFEHKYQVLDHNLSNIRTRIKLIGLINKNKFGVNLDFHYMNSPIQILNEIIDGERSHFSDKSINSSFNYLINTQRIHIDLRSDINLLQREFNKNINQYVLFNPKISLTYPFGMNNYLKLGINHSVKPFNRNKYLNELIITDYRNSKQYIATDKMNKQTSVESQMSFTHVPSKMMLNFSASYIYNQGSFVKNILYNSIQSNKIYSYTERGTHTFKINGMVDKIFKNLNIGVRINSGISNNKFYQSLNSNLLETDLMAYFHAIRISTFFNTKFNFENRLQYISTSLSNKQNSSINNNKITNQFDALYKLGSNFYSTLSYKTYWPESKLSNAYQMMDFKAKYRPSKKPWSIIFEIRNILNIKRYERLSINEYSQTLRTIETMPRYLLLQLNYRF